MSGEYGHCTARGQAASEDASAPYCNKILFTDTDPLATCAWSDFLFKKTYPRITSLAASRRADLYLLTDVDVPWVADIVHYLPENRENFLEQCEKALIDANCRYVKISGEWNSRLQCSIEAVEELMQ